MTWFLFAQYGTAPLLALIARRPLADVEARRALRERAGADAGGVVAQRAGRLQARAGVAARQGRSAAPEYLALPALQLLAVGLNFAMMIVAVAAASICRSAR